MKQALYAIICTVSVFCLSCTKPETKTKTDGNKVTFTCSVDETKMSFNAGKIGWEVGDKIAIFDGEKIETVTLTASDITDEGKTAKFSTTTLSAEATAYYAIYPASAATGDFLDTDDRFIIKNSNLVQDSHNSFFCVSKGERTNGAVSLKFHNAASILHFETSKEDISYVMMVVTSGDNLATDYTFNPYTPENKYKIGSTTVNTVKFNLPSTSGTRSGNIAVEPGTYTFHIDCYNSVGTKIYTYTPSNPPYTFSLGQYSIIKSFDSSLKSLK